MYMQEKTGFHKNFEADSFEAKKINILAKSV